MLLAKLLALAVIVASGLFIFRYVLSKEELRHFGIAMKSTPGLLAYAGGVFSIFAISLIVTRTVDKTQKERRTALLFGASIFTSLSAFTALVIYVKLTPP